MNAPDLCVRASLLLAMVVPFASGATGVNLIANPGFDAAPGGTGYEEILPPGWTAGGNPTVVRWDVGKGFPMVSDPGPPDRGANFASGGRDSSPTSLTQDIDLTPDAALIGSGTVSFELSGYLGGYSSQNDYASLGVQFLAPDFSVLGGASVDGPLAGERQNQTGLLPKSVGDSVPQQTRTARITITFTRAAGTYNDGYADSLSFVLTAPVICPGDFNRDGEVNTADLVSFLGRFGHPAPPGTEQDMNGDGEVNTLDLTRFLGRFGQPCP